MLSPTQLGDFETEVDNLLGQDLPSTQVHAALQVVAAMAKSYCRQDWNELPDDVAAVVKTATLRLLTHPRQLRMSETMAMMSADHREGFTGWSIGELFVLNRYRVRAV